jgi:hypothetical protein
VSTDLACHRCGRPAVGFIDGLDDAHTPIGYCRQHQPISESLADLRGALRELGHTFARALVGMVHRGR